MAKGNQIQKLVNGEIADADDVNQIVEDAGNEGGGIPYDPTTHQRETDGSESLGSTAYPWGSLKVNKEAELVEVDTGSHTAASSVAWKNLRRFLFLKDAPSSYSGQAGKKVTVNAGENALQFTDSSAIPGNIQVFTSSGTWTKPAGIDKVHVKVWGGGGGGYNTGTGGGGGGGGGYSEGIVTVTGDVTVTVGTGGASGGSPAAGGNSSFAGSTTPTANGGAAGTSSSGGAGGTASNGAINISGKDGASKANGGGAGGSFAGGSPGAGGVVGGVGGGGGSSASAATISAGGDGLVIVMY